MTAVSIRMNNPGALNTAAWVEAMPGYVSASQTTPGNRTARFETAEQGIAAWWELLRRYRLAGVTTVGGIITRYGGSGQDYSAYVNQVVKWSGLLRSTVIPLDDDATLLRLARAMFRYEAGINTVPYFSDENIITGFNLGRKHAGLPTTTADDTSADDNNHRIGIPLILRLLLKLFGR